MTRTNLSRALETSARSDLPEPLRGLLESAVEEQASDIHIDVNDAIGIVRFRADGIIHPKKSLAAERALVLINQIQVAARLDVLTPHRPLEGHFSATIRGRRRSIRATIVPAGVDRRAAHIRLMTGPTARQELTGLGMSVDEEQAIRRILRNKHGLVLVAGPTGAGKTETLYALATMCDPANCIVTSIEDPVEFDMSLVRQLEVDAEHDFAMKDALRAMLRMDPDVVLIGEISDRESAQIAGQAALAGRLVLATIHGRSPSVAVEAMHHLGVPFYALGASLRLVIAQRLIRVVCGRCASSRALEPAEKAYFVEAGLVPPATVHVAQGCSACHDYGYVGRTGVFQIVPIDEALGSWLTRGQSPSDIRTRFEGAAVSTFASSALRKVADGVTTFAEVMPLFGAGVDRPLILSGDSAETVQSS